MGGLIQELLESEDPRLARLRSRFSDAPKPRRRRLDG
jgi:hypothetical protein